MFPKQSKTVSKITQNNPKQSKTIYTHDRDNIFPKQSKTVSKIAQTIQNSPK